MLVPEEKLGVVILTNAEHWGFIPSGAKDASVAAQMINARPETENKTWSFTQKR
jgi:putative SOS response-associated peptidase YedK